MKQKYSSKKLKDHETLRGGELSDLWEVHIVHLRGVEVDMNNQWRLSMSENVNNTCQNVVNHKGALRSLRGRVFIPTIIMRSHEIYYLIIFLTLFSI